MIMSAIICHKYISNIYLILICLQLHAKSDLVLNFKSFSGL